MPYFMALKILRLFHNNCIGNSFVFLEENNNLRNFMISLFKLLVDVKGHKKSENKKTQNHVPAQAARKNPKNMENITKEFRKIQV